MTTITSHRRCSIRNVCYLLVVALFFSRSATVEGRWSGALPGGRIAHNVFSRKKETRNKQFQPSSHTTTPTTEKETPPSPLPTTTKSIKSSIKSGFKRQEWIGCFLATDDVQYAAALVSKNNNDKKTFEEKTGLILSSDQLRGGAVEEDLPTINVPPAGANIIRALLPVLKMLLPPIVITGKTVFGFYRSLPKDAIIAQAGLLYCFAGGYYPTLFASVQAARQCGWEQASKAIDDIAAEANLAIDAFISQTEGAEIMTARELIQEKTLLVLRTIDPVKINEATAAIYTTWIGIEAVLSKEFAGTISMALTLGDYIFPVADFAVGHPLRFAIPKDYHRWVPILVGWATKSAAMAVAWRIQRGISAGTSAVAGGFIFSRAVFRLLHKRGVRLGGLIKEKHEDIFIDDVLGVMVAGLGLYSQLGHGWKTGFSFKVPYPLSLVTFPFDWAEKWIQWQITKEADITTNGEA